MNENIVEEMKDEIAGKLNGLPQTFQMFISLYKEAKNRTIACVGQKEESIPITVNTTEEQELPKSMFEMIRKSLGELELKILRQIQEKGNKSQELAEKLGVSAGTIKRRYKLLLTQGMIITTRRTGIKLTPRGTKFLNLLNTITEQC